MGLLGPSVSRAQLSEVLVESNVADATVVVDGAPFAQTNEEGVALVEGLAPGRHTVELRKAGYWNASVRVTLEPGLTTPVVLELRSRSGSGVGNLLVETNVSGAVVALDGEEIGETGPTGQIFVSGVAPGQHQIVARKDGYQSVSRIVTIDETGLDRTTRLQLAEATGAAPAADAPEPTITAGTELPDSLDPSFPTGGEIRTRQPALVVNAGVAEATVRVDDSVRGRTGPSGQLRVRVDSGQHQVAVSKEGGPSAQATAELDLGEERTVTLDLQQSAQGPRTDTGVVPVLVLSLLGLSVVVIVFVIVISKPGGTVARWLEEGLGVSNQTRYELARWIRHPFEERQRFDRYDLLRELRSGEFATIYLADDSEMRRRVRLRILDDPYAGKPNHVESFLEGGRILQDLRESAPEAPIVTAYRCGRENGDESGRPFLSLEYFRGKTLGTHLKEQDVLAVDDAIAVIRQVCVGLQAAHENDVTHGTLTPATVILTQETPQFEIKLTGFEDRGYKYTTEILTDGYRDRTTSYLSPEKFENGRSTWQSDMYAVGMLFYTMVTGSPPFIHDNPVRIVEMHKDDDPPALPDRVPSTIRPVFYRMVSKDPERRPPAKNVISVLDLVEATT